jgi:cellulose synthase operon protein C
MTESLLLLLALVGADAELVPLREHLAHGRYVEGAEAWDSLAAEVRQTPEARWLRARFHAAVGEDAAVTELLAKLLEEFPDEAVWWGRAAEHQWNLGLVDEAAESAAKGLALDSDEPRCRLVQAEVWTARGDLKQALEGYRWFVRYYNRAQPTDAETLLLIGRGAAMYARWKSVSQIFNFIVNTACVDALKADPLCWEAHQLAGALLLEKYNSADGGPELERALAINPHAVEVHVTLAAAALDDLRVDVARRHLDRALETHPTHREALRLQARWLLQAGDLPAAERILEQLKQAAPLEQRAVAVEVAVACARLGDPPLDRLEKLLGSFERIASWEPSDAVWERPIVELAKRNPRPGYFLQDFGAFFEQQRKLRYAEVCYQAAIDHMPQLAQPKTELGMLMFQSGRLDEAQRLLDAAFEADPYHVRVSNMRKVLKVLEGYATITTPHFVIRADSQLDRVLAKYLAEELETVYARVTEEYGYEPPQRTQIELYNKARGLAGINGSAPA